METLDIIQWFDKLRELTERVIEADQRAVDNAGDGADVFEAVEMRKLLEQFLQTRPCGGKW